MKDEPGDDNMVGPRCTNPNRCRRVSGREQLTNNWVSAASGDSLPVTGVGLLVVMVT